MNYYGDWGMMGGMGFFGLITILANPFPKK